MQQLSEYVKSTNMRLFSLNPRRLISQNLHTYGKFLNSYGNHSFEKCVRFYVFSSLPLFEFCTEELYSHNPGLSFWRSKRIHSNQPYEASKLLETDLTIVGFTVHSLVISIIELMWLYIWNVKVRLINWNNILEHVKRTNLPSRVYLALWQTSQQWIVTTWK